MRFALATHVVRKGDGQGRVNLEVVLEALRRGVGVDIYATEIAPELAREPLVRWYPVAVGRIPSHLARELAFSAIATRLLRARPGTPLLTNGCIARVDSDVNACHFVHSSWLRSPVHSSRLVGGLRGRYQWFYSVANARWERGAYSRARKVVAVSEQVAGELREIGVDPARIHVVPNGVDSAEFFPGPADRAKFGLPDGVPLALFAGDIRSPRKNLDTVLEALREVEGTHLAVAGGLQGSPYPEMASRLGIADRVHFLGQVREMPALMRSCDVFAFPSRYEACSLVMLEALSSGLPVITSRTTGGSELVPSDGGYLLDGSDDLPGMRRFLSQASADPDDRLRRSLQARRRAVSLTWSETGRRYLDLLGSD